VGQRSRGFFDFRVPDDPEATARSDVDFTETDDCGLQSEEVGMMAPRMAIRGGPGHGTWVTG
jgi:hypothetical protein